MERQINKEQKRTGCAETESEWQPKKRKWTEKSHTQKITQTNTQNKEGSSGMKCDTNDGKVKIKPSWRWKTVSQRQLPNHFLSISALLLTMFVRLETALPLKEKVTFRHARPERLLDI